MLSFSSLTLQPDTEFPMVGSVVLRILGMAEPPDERNPDPFYSHCTDTGARNKALSDLNHCNLEYVCFAYNKPDLTNTSFLSPENC